MILNRQDNLTNFICLQCNLLGSNLDDVLYVWLDSAAEPVAINLISQGPCSTEMPFVKMWNTDVQVRYPDGGPIPDTATYIQKLEREKQARESGEHKDNRSFFAKYVSKRFYSKKQYFKLNNLIFSVDVHSTSYYFLCSHFGDKS